jgi:subtilisin family serine protease
MMRHALALLLTLLLPAAAGARALDLPVQRPGASVAAPCYAGDVLELRLAPAAARAALPRAAGPTRARSTLRLGVASVDAVSALLGGCEFEPEFVGETPPTDPNETDFTEFWLVHLPPGATLEDALDRFRVAGGVVLALPVATLSMSALPNDSLFANQTWLYRNVSPRHDIMAPEAWSAEDGDTSIVVAIVDTGLLPYHPDLGGTGSGRGNLWTNWAEATGLPGVDDDGNGFVDDWQGWDFVSKAFTPPAGGEDGLDADNDPNDFDGHGTVVAGIIGALADNSIGVAGVVPKIRLMPLRVAWQGSCCGQLSAFVSMTYAAQAIRYATRMGAQVINASWASVDSAGSGLGVAVTAATRAGVAIANASGNNNSLAYLGQRDDVISVAATDSNDVNQAFAVKGPWVDLTAQGTGIVSTFVNRVVGTDSILSYRVPGYRAGMQGTSFAAPQVAGVMALLQAQRRAQGRDPLTPYGLLARLRETADDTRPFNPTIYVNVGTGRLNAYRALTDHPTTSAVRTLGQTVGAPVVLRANTGVTRVVYAMSNQRLVAFDGASADTAWIATLPAAPVGNLAAADFGDGDGPRIYVGTTSGRVLAYDENGAQAPLWAVAPALGSSVSGGLAIGDVTGDGRPEVVAVGLNGRVWAWNSSSAVLPGFPFDPGTIGTTAVALADLDGIAGGEIVFASGDGLVHALRLDGNEFGNWPYAGTPGARAPVIARFAGPGAAPTVLVASGTNLTALNPDGSLRWSQALPNAISADLALGDFTGDDLDEIVVVNGLAISVLDSNGVAIPSRSPQGVPAAPSGSPVVGPMRAGYGACIGARLATGFYVWDDSGHVAPQFPKPGVAGASPALADLDGDGATEIAAGTAFADSNAYAFDAGAGTWNESLAYWPSVRGDDARTGARGYPIALPLYDRIRPAPVTDVVASALSATYVQVVWTNTGDDSLVGRAREAHVIGDRVPFDGTFFEQVVPNPRDAGLADTVVVPVSEGQQWSVYVRMVDDAGNWSAVCCSDTVLAPGSAPVAIADLRIAASHDSTVKLLWTAPTDDGPAGRPVSYEIAGSPAALDSANFATAPLQAQLFATANAGSPESLTVTGLARGRRWTFAVRGVDGTGARSRLSNLAQVVLRTGGAIDGRGGIAIAARPVPGSPPITLDWQGATEAIGTAQRLDILDLGGRVVRRVPLGPEPGGSWTWNGRDAEGRSVPAGLYFARLASGGGHSEARMVLIR